MRQRYAVSDVVALLSQMLVLPRIVECLLQGGRGRVRPGVVHGQPTRVLGRGRPHRVVVAGAARDDRLGRRAGEGVVEAGLARVRRRLGPFVGLLEEGRRQVPQPHRHVVVAGRTLRLHHDLKEIVQIGVAVTADSDDVVPLFLLDDIPLLLGHDRRCCFLGELDVCF